MAFFVTVKILFEMFQNDNQTLPSISDIRQGRGYFLRKTEVFLDMKNISKVSKFCFKMTLDG